MRRIIFSFLILLVKNCLLFAQVGINTDSSLPDNSAMLDVKATNRGVILPRLTTDSRNLIPSPEAGLLIYNTTENEVNFYNGSHWYQVESQFTTTTTGTVQAGGGTSITVSPLSQAKGSAMLDVNDPSRGILIPRTTHTLITSPAEGLMIYETTTNLLTYYNGTQWITLCASSSGVPGASGSQASVGMAVKTDNTNPHHSAILDVSATDKGILLPRLTKTQRDVIFPDTGLIIYNMASDYFEYYNGSEWYQFQTTWVEAPTAGVSLQALNEITWNWNGVPEATGYKWHTTNDYYTAIDKGTGTSHTETGLSCGNGYTRYVWAYNTCGHSDAVSLSQSTLPCFTCGSSLVINHVAGAVAPVTKTVTYGTVTNIPGEPIKCWITSNLGADHQASYVNDATEESAGWYWQFNRKQGYKHDGTTRTPNTTWITLINENTSWLPEEDPCTLELGNGWRVPTHAEWANVDAAGMWSSWYGPWGSGLKMHAAGYLYNENGNVYTRGSSGNYWSSDQNETYTGWGIFFLSSSCIVEGGLKAYGNSVRCIHD